MDDESVGMRIKRRRERIGMSQKVLGQLVDRSADWVKSIENGRRGVPKLPMLLQLAEALGLRDLAELTGNGHAVSVTVYAGHRHPDLGRVQAALTDYRLAASSERHDLAHLDRRVRAAWGVRHASPDHRTALGQLLPDLIRDAQAAARTPGPDRREARRILAATYHLTDFYVAYQSDSSLVWMVADRGLAEAHEADDPYTIACGMWAMVQALRDSGRWDEALAMIASGREMLAPWLDRDGTPNAWRGIAGALEAEAALVHARRGRYGEAWASWDAAEEFAQRLRPDFRHVQTSFSRAVQAANAVTLGVELQRSGEALRAARSIDDTDIASVPRRARHMIEVARAYDQRGESAAVLALLDRAQRTAPETIGYNRLAKDMLLALRKSPPTGMASDVRKLCERVGVAA
jgi:transcriptional regulator with XRE-family HTH domain